MCSGVEALSPFSHCSSHIRFGFDDDYAAARSFLFFTTNANFTRTSFKGLERTLRKEETPEDRLEHRLQEGFDFSGFETLREMSRAPEEPDILPLSPPPPPRAELLWPLPPERQCLESPRDQRNPRVSKCRGAKSDFPWIEWASDQKGTEIRELVEPRTEPLYDVVNEMVLSYLATDRHPTYGQS